MRNIIEKCKDYMRGCMAITIALILPVVLGGLDYFMYGEMDGYYMVVMGLIAIGLTQVVAIIVSKIMSVVYDEMEKEEN